MGYHKLTKSTICARHDVVLVHSINCFEQKQLSLERKQFSDGNKAANSQSYVTPSIQ